MSPPYVLRNHQRERPNRYRADLYVHDVLIGRVERGWSMGGRGADQYVAIVEGITVASGRTLNGLLREDLLEWVEEERKMEQDAIWIRLR